MSAAICLVVPCYNEARRLQYLPWARLCRYPGLHLLFVDDGSTDATSMHMARVAAAAPAHAVRCLHLPRNVGKGEAVRLGLLHALQQAFTWVGYVDADLATPTPELEALLNCLQPDGPAVVLGSRVRRLGARIERQPWRHLAGRLFAQGAALALQIPIYDSQCGAKLFRVSDGLHQALREPFVSRWVFDVELLGRLLQPSDASPGITAADMLEVPLGAWSDVPGSKLTFWDFPRAAASLMHTGWTLHRRRTSRHAHPPDGPAAYTRARRVMGF